MTIRPASLVLALALAGPALPNDVIIGNLSIGTGTGTSFGSTSTTVYKAFGFTMGDSSYRLEEVILTLSVTGAVIDPQLEIWSDASGTPGAPLFTLDDPANLTGQGGFVFPAAAPFVLAQDTTYWLYLQETSPTGDVFSWRGTNPATLPSGPAATAVGYEFNGAPSSFFNQLEIRGVPDGVGTSYCAANVNSTGAAGEIRALGSSAVTDNDLTLFAAELPPMAFGFFLVSQTQGFTANPGGSSGNLCVTGDVGRYVGTGQIQQSDAGGAFELSIDLANTPQPQGFVPILGGETWNFQAWFRDAGPSGPTSNFTDGVGIDFQ